MTNGTADSMTAGWIPGLGRRLLSSSVLRQSGIYTGTNLAASVLGAVVSAVLARNLSTSQFGTYSFISAMLLFAAGFFEFGLFLPAARLMAAQEEPIQRQTAGAAIVTYVPVGIAFSAVLFGLSFVVDSVFRIESGDVVRMTLLLAFGLPFGFLAEWLALGAGRLHMYALVTFGAQALFLALIAAALLLGKPVSAGGAVSLQLVAINLGWIAFILWLKPGFRDARNRVRELLSGARNYGWQVYVGRILSVGTYNLDVPMLAAFTNSSPVGFYVLAGAIAGASGMPALAISTALFRTLSGKPTIERRWLITLIAVGVASTVTAILLAGPFISFVFSSRYSAAVPLVAPLAAAAGVRGITGLYNSFLSAHGLGKELRNAGLALAVSNVVLNFALIPTFGAAGAAWASLIALIVNLGAHVVGYRRYRLNVAI